MCISHQILFCLWAASQGFFVVAAAVEPQNLLDELINSPLPEELAPALCEYCSSLDCPNPNNPSVFPGWVSNQEVIEECRSCSDPFTKDCFCTAKYHPRGCTIRDCGPEDGIAPPDDVPGYTCYCSDAFRPSDCVSRSNPNNPRCEPTTLGDGTYRDYCQCDTETSDPDNCNIRVCDPDELTGDGYRCICGPRCDQRPDGCVKERKV